MSLRDYLFPAVLGLSRRISLTGNTTFTKNMLGCLVVLNGYQLNLVGLAAKDFGVVFIVGAGTTIGKKVATLGAEEALVIAVSGSDFDYPLGGGSSGDGVNSIDDVPGLTAALAAKAAVADVIPIDGTLTDWAGTEETKLKAVPTAGLAVGSRIGLVVNRVVFGFELVTGWDFIMAAPFQVVPSDYDGDTNNKTWRLLSPAVDPSKLLGAGATGVQLLQTETVPQARNALNIRREGANVVRLVKNFYAPYPETASSIRAMGSGYGEIHPNLNVLGSQWFIQDGENLGIHLETIPEATGLTMEYDGAYGGGVRVFIFTMPPGFYMNLGELVAAVNGMLADAQGENPDAANVRLDYEDKADELLPEEFSQVDVTGMGLAPQIGDVVITTHNKGLPRKLIFGMLGWEEDPTFGLVDSFPFESIYSMGRMRELIPAFSTFNVNGTGATAAAYQSGCRLYAGTGASGWARAAITDVITGIPSITGVAPSCEFNFAISVVCSVKLAAGSNGGVARVIMGDAGAGSPPIGSANALSARGFGFEIGYVGGMASVRGVTHDGTDYAETVGIETHMGSTGLLHIVVAKVAKGVALYVGSMDNDESLLSRTQLIEGARTFAYTTPTNGSYGGNFLSALVANTASSPTVPVEFHVMSARIILGSKFGEQDVA